MARIVELAAGVNELARLGSNSLLAALLARLGLLNSTSPRMANELADAEQFTLSVRAPRRVRGYLQLPSYRLRRSHKP